MSGYLGSYLHQVDPKGRLSLPAPFRREAAERPMVLLQAFAESLSLFPEDAWQAVESRLREMLRLQPASRGYVLRVTANALEVVPDRQGRILVPQRMLDAAAIEGSALLVGVIDRIEIWSPARFEAATAAPNPEYERFANQIFG
jgi:MraZ protein